MRVIVNIVPLHEGAVIRERNILEHLSKIDQKNEYVILGRKETRDIFRGLGANFRFEEVSLNAKNYFARLLWENFRLPFLLKNLKADILYFPHQLTNFLGFTKKVITIQNALPFEEQIIQELAFLKRLKFRLLASATTLSISQADCTIFFSQYLKTKVLKNSAKGYFPVIRHGAPAGPANNNPSDKNLRHFLETYGIRKDYMLTVSHIYPYKNIVNLVKAYRMAKDRCLNLEPLVVAGRRYDRCYFSQIRSCVEEHGLNDSIKFVGDIKHKNLPFFYSGCKFFVFPSKCENAPVTLMEALAFGLPITCSRIKPNIEICEESALYFNPDECNEISECLVAMHNNENLRENLSRRASERAKNFSWEKSAREILSVFEKVYNA